MKNFVFDVYGTLVDINTDESSKKFKKRFIKYFKKYNKTGLDFWAEYYLRCAEKSRGGGEFCEIDLLSVFTEICAKSGSDLSAEKIKKIAYKFRRLSRTKLILYKGVKGMLKKLKSLGAQLYIISNAQSCFTLPELKKLRVLKYFNGVAISSDYGIKKPSPQFFAQALKKFGLDKRQTLYIGNDFTCDIAGAHSAGIKAAYIKSNLSPQSDLINNTEVNADFYADAINGLTVTLTKLCER